MGITRFDQIYHQLPGPQKTAGSVAPYAGLPMSNVELYSKYSCWFWNPIHSDDFPAATDGPGADFTVTVTGTTPAASMSADLVPGRLIVTISAADNDSLEAQYAASTGIGEAFNLLAGKKRYFETSILLTDANDDADTVEQIDWFVGYCIRDTTVIDGATDFIGFHSADGSGLINFVAGKNAGTSGALVDDIVQSTGVTLVAANAGTAAANFTKLAFLADGVDTVYVWANDAHVATVSSTTELPDDENMCLTIAVQNGEAVAKIAHFGHFTTLVER